MLGKALTSLNGQLHYPHDLDGPLNESVTDKIHQYRADYYNRPCHTISFVSVTTSTTVLLHCELVCLLFLQDHQKTDHFLAVSGVHLDQSTFHYRHVVFS